jgi:hypothetical protein
MNQSLVGSIYGRSSVKIAHYLYLNKSYLSFHRRYFRNQPIWNKNCLWRPCLLTNRDKMSILYRGPSIDASYQVSVRLDKRFQRRRFFKIGLSEKGGSMVSNATFNNISVISWLSVLLVEKTGVPKEKTTTLSQVTNKLCHILLYILDLDWEGFEYLTLVVIGTDCIGCQKASWNVDFQFLLTV